MIDGRAVRTRSGAVLLAHGDVVVKVHASTTRPEQLRARARLVSGSAAQGLWAPLLAGPRRVTGPLLITVWARLTPLRPDAAQQPWAEAGDLLARLHRVPPAAATGPARPAPGHGGPARLHRALRRLALAPASSDRDAVLAAGRAVAEELRGPPDGPRCVAHGDWHLGQLGRLPGEDRLRLLDLDDVGIGDPAWDLGRPAGFWAAGLLPDDAWADFLGAYRAADGPAVTTTGDPWPRLDGVARAAVVTAAASAVLEDGPSDIAGARDHEAAALVAACRRMPRT